MDQDIVKVIFSNGEYYLAPLNNERGEEVPRHLFETYQRIREVLNDLRASIRPYVNPPRDVLMTIVKDPTAVPEGKVIKFDSDEED